MTGAIGGLVLVDTAANDHVELAIDQSLDHPTGTWRVICRVAVDEHIDIGVYVGKHPPDHETLAAVLFLENLGTRGAGDFGGLVR